MPGLDDDDDDVSDVTEDAEPKVKKPRSWQPVAGVVAGAFVGGVFSAAAVWTTLHQETQRVKDADTAAATGAARVITANLDDAVVRLCAVGRSGTFSQTRPQLQSPVKLADRELVAATATADQWAKFALADQALGQWQEDWSNLRASLGNGHRFKAKSAALSDVVAKAMDSRTALGPVAGFPKGTKQWMCDTRKWKSKYAAP